MRPTIAILVLVAAAALLWFWSGDPPRPVEVPLEDTTTWMERMREPGEIAFVAREPVQGDALPPSAPSRTVATLGPLDESVEVDLIANFEQQVRSIEQQIRDCPRPADGDPLGQLGAELKVADLAWTRARMEFASDMIRAKDYATVKTGTQLPPEVDGFDRIVHGNERLRDEAVLVVFYVPRGHDRLRGAHEYRNALYQGYWEAFIANFNAQPLDTRKARIARHRQATSQQQSQLRNQNVSERLSPEELQASIIRGPIEIDDATWTLSRR